MCRSQLLLDHFCHIFVGNGRNLVAKDRDDHITRAEHLFVFSEFLEDAAAYAVADHGGFADLTTDDDRQTVIFALGVIQKFERHHRRPRYRAFAVDGLQLVVSMKTVLFGYHECTLALGRFGVSLVIWTARCGLCCGGGEVRSGRRGWPCASGSRVRGRDVVFWAEMFAWAYVSLAAIDVILAAIYVNLTIFNQVILAIFPLYGNCFPQFYR